MAEPGTANGTTPVRDAPGSGPGQAFRPVGTPALEEAHLLGDDAVVLARIARDVG